MTRHGIYGNVLLRHCIKSDTISLRLHSDIYFYRNVIYLLKILKITMFRFFLHRIFLVAPPIKSISPFLIIYSNKRNRGWNVLHNKTIYFSIENVAYVHLIQKVHFIEIQVGICSLKKMHGEVKVHLTHFTLYFSCWSKEA